MSETSREAIPFALPDIGPAEVKAVSQTLAGGWLTSGPRVREFEQKFSDLMGGRPAVALNSATAGLHLAVHQLNPRPGDWVITSPLTFAATAEVIRYYGAHPLFVDIGSDYCLNRETVETGLEYLRQKIETDPAFAHLPPPNEENIKGLLPVHYGGLAAPMKELWELGRERDWPVIEDAAHSFPTYYQGKLIGARGDFTVFSFYATKSITTGEGGMLVTEDAWLADRLRQLRLHGISRNTWNRHLGGADAWRYSIDFMGFKYNMPDPAAAMGLVQLGRATELKEKRARIAGRYDRALKNLPGLTLPPRPETPGDGETSDHCWYLYSIHIGKEAPLGRDEFCRQLARAGIGTSVHFIPLYHHPYYRDLYPWQPKDFPECERVFQGLVSLPVYSRLSEDQQDKIIATVLNLWQT